MDISSYINNDVVVIILAFIVALYASQTRVEMPEYIKALFRNNIFRVVFIFLLLMFPFKQAPHVALTIALIFVLTLYFLNYAEMKENFAHLERFRNVQKRREKMKNIKKSSGGSVMSKPTSCSAKTGSSDGSLKIRYPSSNSGSISGSSKVSRKTTQSKF